MYKVLLADDEVWVLESLKRIDAWAKHGFEVVAVALNGPEAMEKIHSLRPDLVVTDIRMPGCTGLELMAAFPQPGWRPLFAVISGHAEFAYAQKAMLQGAIGYCVKPVDAAELGSLLDKAARLLEGEAASLSAKNPARDDDTIPTADPGRLPGNRVIAEALSYLDLHFMDKISVPELGKRFFLNPNYFCNLFKKEVGVSFTEYLAKVRIQHAIRLLTEDILPVTRVASACGYDNYFYFTRIFKRQTGKTPSQVRAGRPGS